MASALPLRAPGGEPVAPHSAPVLLRSLAALHSSRACPVAAEVDDLLRLARDLQGLEELELFAPITARLLRNPRQPPPPRNDARSAAEAFADAERAVDEAAAAAHRLRPFRSMLRALEAGGGVALAAQADDAATSSLLESALPPHGPAGFVTRSTSPGLSSPPSTSPSAPDSRTPLSPGPELPPVPSLPPLSPTEGKSKATEAPEAVEGVSHSTEATFVGPAEDGEGYDWLVQLTLTNRGRTPVEVLGLRYARVEEPRLGPAGLPVQGDALGPGYDEVEEESPRPAKRLRMEDVSSELEGTPESAVGGGGARKPAEEDGSAGPGSGSGSGSAGDGAGAGCWRRVAARALLPPAGPGPAGAPFVQARPAPPGLYPARRLIEYPGRRVKEGPGEPAAPRPSRCVVS
eukprot:tig00000042_g15606.t1